MNKIDPNLRMGTVTLTVVNLERSITYYNKHIGLRVLAQTESTATLGTAVPLLHLREAKNARHYPNATGLYHFALLVPSRTELARILQHLVKTGTPIGGASDHHVSEALYLSDPDGHGIEIYRDRPRSEWLDADGNFFMTTQQLDVNGVMATHDGKPFTELADGTVMGHVHLQVGDVAQAEAFYTNLLGFDTMAHYPGAGFVSAGGYHHHLGFNIWHSRGASAPPEDAVRLVDYTILVSDSAEISKISTRLSANDYPFEQNQAGLRLTDPAGNGIVISTV